MVLFTVKYNSTVSNISVESAYTYNIYPVDLYAALVCNALRELAATGMLFADVNNRFHDVGFVVGHDSCSIPISYNSYNEEGDK